MTETTSPREALKELVERNGESLLQNPDRCEGLLKDHCTGGRREISAIVGALQERIPLELRSSWQTAMTPEAMRARMVQRLEDNRGLAPAVANWAVDAWSYALGVPLPSSVIQGGEGAQTGSSSLTAAGGVESEGMRERSREWTGETRDGETAESAGRREEERKKNVRRGSWVAAAAALACILLIGEHAGWFQPKPAPPAPTPTPGQNQPSGQSGQPASGQPAGQQPDAQKPSTQTGPVSARPAAARKPSPSGAAEEPQMQGSAADMLPAGTTVVVRLDGDASSQDLNVGDTLPATLVQPLTANGNVVFPSGAHAVLRVSGLEQTRGEGARTVLRLTLTQLSGGERSLALVTGSRVFQGPAKLKDQAERGGIGAAGGAVAGFLAGHLFHHGGTGAALGAGGGAAIGAVTAKVQPVHLHAEQVMSFRLEAGARLHARS